MSTIITDVFIALNHYADRMGTTVAVDYDLQDDPEQKDLVTANYKGFVIPWPNDKDNFLVEVWADERRVTIRHYEDGPNEPFFDVRDVNGGIEYIEQILPFDEMTLIMQW